MRFDAAKALETFRQLGDPRFAGPDREARVADFVAEQFVRLGLTVERREVVGSRFPQWAAPWIVWIGFGILITAEYVLLLTNSFLPVLLALVLALYNTRWLWAIISNAIHLGRRVPPREAAPLVIASLPDVRPASTRVVFQALLGGLEPDLSHLVSWTRFAACAFLLSYPLFLFLVGGTHPSAGFLIFTWAWVLWCLFDESRYSRRLRESPFADRYGLALLIELARSWPRTGSRPIEPVFVAAGGQQLDYAGQREIVRLLGSEWAARPSLVVRLFAAGAGDPVWLSTSDPRAAGTLDLARDAGRSLWIPVATARPWPWLPLMPLWPGPEPSRDSQAAIALIGAGSSASAHASTDPQALHRAAQLATEIALRWAKRHQPPDRTPDLFS